MALWETIIGAADLPSMLAYPELRYLPTIEIERWRASYERRLADPKFDRARAQRIAENRVVLLKALADGGARILFGTDAPQQFSVPGFSIHREFPLMLAAGMSRYDILRSATRTVGEHLAETDRFGVIAPGARADLVLVRANPLADLAHLREPAGVMVRGRWLAGDDIAQVLAAYAERRD
jgi:imidazolonepropionase-like amidohydrolase